MPQQCSLITTSGMYTIPFGLGLDAAFTFPFHRNLVFRADAEVKFAISNNIWAESFLIFGGDVGIGTISSSQLVSRSLPHSYGLHSTIGLSLRM